MANEIINFYDVELLNGFWKNRFELNAQVSIYAVQKVFEDSGRFNAVRFKKGNENIHEYYDSDVAKWMEAVAYLLAYDRERFQDLEIFCDELIVSMIKHQREDGYFNSYFLQVAPDRIFNDRNMHELYCIGHLIEAAIAYDKFTGKHSFLAFAEKMAECVDNIFRVEQSAGFVTCGHEEIELALFLLYEYTEKEKYKTLAEFFIDQRGNNELDKKRPIGTPIIAQEQVPARQLRRAEGHAVRATYFYSGMADMVRISKDKELEEACLALYEDIIKRKLFVTGGVGSSRIGEAFTIGYDLPNLSAYSESCAAIGLMMFSMRMQKLAMKGEYANTIEKVLYNGFLSSTSLDGKSFFYENPLEVCRKESGKDIQARPEERTLLPIWQRKEVFECSCCPPNINRWVASIANLIFSKTEEGIYINQFMRCRWKGGLRVETNYPNDGEIKITSNNYPYKKLFVRVPEWCNTYTFMQNGKVVTPIIKDGYAELEIEENVNVTLTLDMAPKFIECNPHVRDNAGRVCLTRGPVVYAIEEVDNGEDLYSLAVDRSNPAFAEEFSETYGLNVLYCNGEKSVCEENAPLYQEEYARKKQRIKFIPYYAFANREESDMLVWVNKI